jgi:prepilin-type N-terminal cleavage/methylation domain-containing protein
MISKPAQPYPQKSKNGFTLVEVLIVIVILAILVGVVVMAVGGVFSNAKDSAYAESRGQFQQAVAAYTATKASLLPILAGNYTNAECQNCKIIDLSALLTANGGILRQAPTGLYLSADGNDNCGGDARLGCETGSSYIWIIDSDGTVFSYCTKPGQGGTNNSGYQNVWP